MPPPQLSLDALPGEYREVFRQFAEILLELAGSELLGLSAFGGWLVGDPLFRGTPARSVAVLRSVDLRLLDRLASSGAHFGRKNLNAPLIMTPEYIRRSADAFPLELLEIQQLQAPVLGADHFADLNFTPRDVRLQCEREFKGELIQLRQGLLAAAGKHRLLSELCRACAMRLARLLRGVLYLAEVRPAPNLTARIVEQAADVSGCRLPTLAGVVAEPAQLDFAEFERFYHEVDALAGYVDAMPDR